MKALVALLVIAAGCSDEGIPPPSGNTAPAATPAAKPAPPPPPAVIVPNMPGKEKAKAVLRMLDEADRDGRLFPGCEAITRAHAYVNTFDESTRASALGKKAIARLARAEGASQTSGAISDDDYCKGQAALFLKRMRDCGLSTDGLPPERLCREIPGAAQKMSALRSCDAIKDLLGIAD